MARAKKDGQYINCYIEKDVVETLEQYCNETGLTKTVAIERILTKYFDEYFGKDDSVQEKDEK